MCAVAEEAVAVEQKPRKKETKNMKERDQKASEQYLKDTQFLFYLTEELIKIIVIFLPY